MPRNSQSRKRVAGIIAAVLMATGISSCGSGSTGLAQIPAGQIVSCSSIRVAQTNPAVLPLPCMSQDSVVDVGSIKGPALINVWGSWCEPCVNETEFLRSFYTLHSSQVALIGVDIEEETATSGQDFVVSHGITWPQVMDKSSTIRRLSGVGVPTTLFITSDGKIAKTFVGPFESLDQIIREANMAFSLNLESS